MLHRFRSSWIIFLNFNLESLTYKLLLETRLFMHLISFQFQILNFKKDKIHFNAKFKHSLFFCSIFFSPHFLFLFFETKKSIVLSQVFSAKIFFRCRTSTQPFNSQTDRLEMTHHIFFCCKSQLEVIRENL